MVSSIQKQIDAVKKEIREAAKSEVISLALGIHGRLVENPPEGTPVDTGWASVNWWLSVGQTATGNDGPAGETATRAAVQAAGTASVLTWQPSDGAIYISNHVPYINRLNNGWSQQSPAGFVDKAVQIEIASFTARVK